MDKYLFLHFNPLNAQHIITCSLHFAALFDSIVLIEIIDKSTMKKAYTLSLHIFRRDLRLQDNTALIEALKQSEHVVPCFIFDKRQIEENNYKSLNSIQFMVNSLNELDQALRKKNSRLYFFYGIAEEIIKTLILEMPIRAIFHNRDYTPFSQFRDNHIEDVCQQNNVDYHCYADALLHEPEEVLKHDGKPYTVFTPAFRKASLLLVRNSKKNNYGNYYHKPITFSNDDIIKKLCKNINPNLLVKGGRNEAQMLLKKISALGDYKILRDYPAKAATSKLSAHLKFGTLSVRECHEVICDVFGKHHTLINELHWRDFFTHIAHYFPHVFESAFHRKYNALTWSYNETHFQAWCDGQTGFPIVDAGMRELNTTGYMHNRVRMITASFLVKDLHIDWRRGEKYFSNQLVDYDPAVNNGNWQWAASTGCDAQPYFRIFNPWLQQAKFDPDCEYIKRWVPELAELSNKVIHTLYDAKSLHTPHYPTPIVSHSIESKKAQLLYKYIH